MTDLVNIVDRDEAITNDRSQSIAIEWCGRRLSYANLEAAVSALTDRLVMLGAARASVLVMGPLCPAYIVGLLATWRAGAVLVPVDAGLTAGQYSWLEQRTCPAVIVSSDVTPVDQYRWATAGTAEVVLDSDTGQVIVESVPEIGYRTREFHDPDASYVIPTSGSTGEPKAVVGSRRGLEVFLAWFQQEFGLTGSDRCCAVTRVNFDPSLRELLGVLGVGGTLSLPSVDAQLDLSAMADHLIDGNPTIVFLVPSIATRLAREPRLAAPPLAELRLIFFAGEVLSRRVVEQWAAIAQNAEIVNLYGQTEATLAQLYRRNVQQFVRDEAAAIPVGNPRPGVEVTVADDDGLGIGEVLLSVDASALGVLDAASWDDSGVHPTIPIPAPLPTGDLGYWSSDGELVIIGRSGNEIKFGGRRVSFSRLIDAVEALPEVRQCVVVEHEGPQVFVSTDHSDGVAGELIQKIHGIGAGLELPRFRLHLRQELPILRSGKIDRRELLESIDRIAADTGAEDGPAAVGQAEIEQMLRGLLGLDAGAIGLVDSGITSLDMLEAVARINRSYGIRLTIQECFGLRDVPSVAREIDKRGRVNEGSVTAESACVPAAETAGVYPLSTRQSAYIWACMSGGNANWCNLSREIKFEHRWSRAAVESAMRTLLMRHDTLGLALSADWQSQTYTPPTELTCPVRIVDTGVATASDAFRAGVQSARTALVAELIDPTAPPPMRAVLVGGPTALRSSWLRTTYL